MGSEHSAAPAMIPVIAVDSADPYERGRMIGARAKPWIDRSLELYARVFEHYTGLEWSRVVEHAQAFRAVISEYSPAILAEIDGMADGAGAGRGDILALNVRSEIMFGLKITPPAECTSFFAAAEATADGHVLMGQNWDWKPGCLSTTILLDVGQGPDAPGYMTIVEAGLLAKTGFNSAGVGLATNTLISPFDKGEPGIPYHVLLRAVLNCTAVAQAEDLLAAASCSASANYLLADAAGSGVSVETWPGRRGSVARVEAEQGTIGHANCFVCDVGFDDVGAQEIPDGPERVRQMCDLLAGARGRLDVRTLHQICQSHGDLYPNSICRHPDESLEPIAQLMTVASVIYDLTDRIAHVCLGTPCTAERVPYRPRFAMGEA